MNGWALTQHGATHESSAPSRMAPEERCGSCRYFCQAPHEIERQMPGLKSLGSMFASVRASDGLCRRHDRYLGASSRCDDYDSEI